MGEAQKDTTPAEGQDTPRTTRQEERELVTGGKPLVDDDLLEQPRDDKPHDEGAGKDGPTPNPAKIAP